MTELDNEKDSNDAQKLGDFATEVLRLRPLAERGDGDAQYNLGVAYAQGVIPDYREAVKWYRRAAEQGDGDAQNNLGVMYAKGRGVIQDYHEALKWFRLGANKKTHPRNSISGSCSARGEVSRKTIAKR